MTSIPQNTFNPRTMMDARISAAVSSGTISTSDQTALSAALDSIDSSLSANRANGTKPSSGMKDQIDGLIEQQVKDGKLTDEQATELKTFFAQGPQGRGGPEGPGGAGGPPPSDSSSCGGASDETSTASTATDQDAAQQIDVLMAFLMQLRSSLSSDDTYAASPTASGSANSGLVVNTKI